MNQNWTPENRVSITDAGMVIELKLGAVQMASLKIFVEANQLCVRGRHDDFGPFETRIGLTSDHSLTDAKVVFSKGILRIEVPTKNKSSPPKPRAMLIYCNGCGTHFDIVVTGKGSRDYRCPACGKVHAFDLEAFVNQALEQGKQMLKKRRGRR